MKTATAGRAYVWHTRQSLRPRQGTASDPLGYVDTMSLYEYVGANPVGRIDPTGLSEEDAGGGDSGGYDNYDGASTWEGSYESGVQGYYYEGGDGGGQGAPDYSGLCGNIGDSYGASGADSDTPTTKDEEQIRYEEYQREMESGGQTSTVDEEQARYEEYQRELVSGGQSSPSPYQPNPPVNPVTTTQPTVTYSRTCFVKDDSKPPISAIGLNITGNLYKGPGGQYGVDFHLDFGNPANTNVYIARGPGFGENTGLSADIYAAMNTEGHSWQGLFPTAQFSYKFLTGEVFTDLNMQVMGAGLGVCTPTKGGVSLSLVKYIPVF